MQPWFAVLDGGFDISGQADPQHPLVIDVDAVVVAQIVIEPPVALIRAFFMNLLDCVSQTLVFLGPAAQFLEGPLVVGRTSRMKQLTGCFNGMALLRMAFPDCFIHMALSYS